MKRRHILLLGGAVVGIALIIFLVFPRRPGQWNAALPDPNGYDDFEAAARSLVLWTGDLNKLSPEAIRGVISSNTNTLEKIREGLKKECAVPVMDIKGFSSTHTFQLQSQKHMAQLLVAEGKGYLEAGRTNEAARSFADGLRFAHAAHHRGLMIDGLVGIACQALGSRPLSETAPYLSPGTARTIIEELLVLDHDRESPDAILDRERAWARANYGSLRITLQSIVAGKSMRASEEGFKKSVTRSVAGLRLVMTELAVRGFQATNGQPPRALAELVPAWLPAVPVDPFSGKPLVYRPATNSFLLYSVGPDERDDQGIPPKRGAKDLGDLLPSTP